MYEIFFHTYVRDNIKKVISEEVLEVMDYILLVHVLLIVTQKVWNVLMD